MTVNFVACSRCGEPTQAPSHYVPRVTWNGRLVCSQCERQLLGREQRPNQQNSYGIDMVPAIGGSWGR